MWDLTFEDHELSGRRKKKSLCFTHWGIMLETHRWRSTMGHGLWKMNMVNIVMRGLKSECNLFHHSWKISHHSNFFTPHNVEYHYLPQSFIQLLFQHCVSQQGKHKLSFFLDKKFSILNKDSFFILNLLISFVYPHSY